MFRIDSFGTAAALEAPAAPGGTVGYFTEGDPQTATPATVVSADWLNTVQEELIAILLAAGIDPDKADRDQVVTAIKALQEDAKGIADFVIANNQAAQNITSLIFDKTKFKSAVIEYDMYRKTDAPTEVSCYGKVVAMFKPVANAWAILPPEEIGDDCGVTFTIDAATGQVKYTSSDIVGANYSGLMRIKVTRFKIT